MADEHQFCTFVLGGHHFGIDVLKVQEIIRYQEMTRVPLAPPVVRGLINLRGQIVTAIDLRRRLELPERTDGQLPVNVVVKTDDGAVSLLVDEIGDWGVQARTTLAHSGPVSVPAGTFSNVLQLTTVITGARCNPTNAAAFVAGEVEARNLADHGIATDADGGSDLATGKSVGETGLEEFNAFDGPGRWNGRHVSVPSWILVGIVLALR